MMIRPQLFPLLLALAASMMLHGCAAIIKGTHSRVEVDGPRDAEFSWLDGTPIPMHVRTDGSYFLKLRSDSTHHIVARYAGASDTLLIPHRLNGWWVAADIITPAFSGLLLDGVSGSWFDLDDVAISYLPDSVARAYKRRPGWFLTDEKYVVPDNVRKERKLGLIVCAQMGIVAPVVQVPILGNHVMIGAGYRLHPSVELLAMYEGQGCTELSAYEGEARIRTSVCDLVTSTWSAEGRYLPIDWLYGSASFGIMSLSADSLVIAGNGERAPGFDRSAPVAALGIGVRIWDVLTIEYRRQFGFGRLDMGSGSSGLINFGTFRYGINLTF